MRFATLKGERDLSALVGRLFAVRGRRATTVSDEAEAALLRANPQLRDFASVPAGATIIVPDVAGTKHTEEAWPPEVAAAEIVEEVREALAGFGAMLDTSATRRADEARETLRLLKSRELKGVVAKVPGLKGRLPKATDETKLRLEEADSLNALQKEVLGQLAKDLQELVKRLT
jgi:phage tail protein X